MSDHESRPPSHGYVPPELACSDPEGNLPVEGETFTTVEADLLWTYRSWARTAQTVLQRDANIPKEELLKLSEAEIMRAFARALARACGLVELDGGALIAVLAGSPPMVDPKDLN